MHASFNYYVDSGFHSCGTKDMEYIPLIKSKENLPQNLSLMWHMGNFLHIKLLRLSLVLMKNTKMNRSLVVRCKTVHISYLLGF